MEAAVARPPSARKVRYELAAAAAAAAAKRAEAALLAMHASALEVEERIKAAFAAECSTAVAGLRVQVAAEVKQLQAVEEELQVRASQLSAAAAVVDTQPWDAADLAPFNKLCELPAFDGGEPTFSWSASVPAVRAPAVDRKALYVPARGDSDAKPRHLRALVAVADASPACAAVQAMFWSKLHTMTIKHNCGKLLRRDVFASPERPSFLQRVCDALVAWADEPPVVESVCAAMHNCIVDCHGLARDARVRLAVLPALRGIVSGPCGDREVVLEAVASIATMMALLGPHATVLAEAQLLAEQLVARFRERAAKGPYTRRFLLDACTLPAVQAAVVAAGGLSRFFPPADWGGCAGDALRRVNRAAALGPPAVEAMFAMGAIAFTAELAFMAPSHACTALEVMVRFLSLPGAKEQMAACGALDLAALVFAEQKAKLGVGNSCSCDSDESDDARSPDEAGDEAGHEAGDEAGHEAAPCDPSWFQSVDWEVQAVKAPKPTGAACAEARRAVARQLLAFLA